MIANILVGTTHAAFTADDLVTAQAALRQVMIDDVSARFHIINLNPNDSHICTY